MYAERSQSRPALPPEPESRAPRIAVRGRSLLTLVIAPEAPLDAWLAALDAQLLDAPDFFASRPVIADLAAVHDGAAGLAPLVRTLDALAARRLKLIGVEGIDALLLSGTQWARLPTRLTGREAPREVKRSRPAAAATADPSFPSLVIDRPVRSGQSIIFEDGDVTVIGTVASGAEVVAGGSIHVQGALRGRAIAGVRAGEGARIFCRRLEAELVAIAGFYRTADDWGADLHGRPAQVSCEAGALQLGAIE